ncbi:MAG: HAMP domain-containing protein [Magnetococcales bacterium]|nr:HAMP domain-containing protein [Magnetococcales bacterium]
MRFFVKLFFSFWITVIFLGSMIAWTADRMRGDFEQRMPDSLARQMKERMVLADILSLEGVARLREVLSSKDDRDEFLVIGPDQRDILGRPFSPEHDRVMEKLKQRHAFDPLVVTGPDGAGYRIFTRPPRPSLGRVMIEHPWMPLLLILASGAAVFLLALHFTRPIKRLRETSLRLAEGDLRVRYTGVPLRIPDELSALGDAFNFMAGRLDQLFHAHKRLIRDISHELRSPLARMRFAFELVEPGDDASRENLGHLGVEMERLDALIGQILTLSRHETLVAAPKEDWIEITGLIETVVADVRFEARQMERVVEMDLGEEVIIKADGVQLRSALENVIRNALRHTPEQGKVHITFVNDRGQAVISVHDEGEGVPEDQLALIFQPFYRVGDARDPEQGGFGLGLAIASQAVRQHEGTITAANRLGGGLVVTIRLPIPAIHPEVLKDLDAVPP